MTSEIIKRWTPYVHSQRVNSVHHEKGTTKCSRNELANWLAGKAEIDNPLHGIEFESTIKINVNGN